MPLFPPERRLLQGRARSPLVTSALLGVALLGVALLAACQDSPGAEETDLDGTAGAGATGTGGDVALSDVDDLGPAGSDLSCDHDAALAESPLLKLSTVQYRNTVRDFLRASGLEAILAGVEPLLATIPSDSLGGSFRGLDPRVAVEHVQGFFDVGAFVGDALLADPELLGAVAGACATEETMSPACFEAFLSRFLLLAQRRPLLPADRELYGRLNDGTRTGPELVRDVVVVALSSPRFIYHVEVDGHPVGGRDDLLELDSYELANRLSYTFWQTMPDAELFAAAEDGSLLETVGYAAQLERVWQDPRAEATIGQFWTEWLKLEKFTGFETSRPAFQALTEGEPFGQPGHDHYADMVQEIADLTRLFTFQRPGSLHELLTTNLSVTQSADLASLYGVAPWDGAGTYPVLENRAGLMQRAALLVSNLEQTNPFHRGALVRRQLLCDPLPEPDPNALPPGSLDPPPSDEALTTRQRFSAKVDGNALCEACHGGFSNIGYVLEAFDAVGRFRTSERVYDEATGELLAELPIDTEAVVNIEVAAEDPVSGPAEMNQVIAKSGKVEACLAENYFRYFSRRAVVASSLDACVVADLSAQLARQEGGLAAAFQRLAQVPTFFARKVGPR